MKNWLILVLFIAPSALLAQWDENDRKSVETEKRAPEKEPEPDFSHPRERWYIGGDFSAFLSNGGSILNLSPAVGYKLTKGLMAGVGLTYQYTSWFDYYNNRYTNNMFGERVFLRQDLFKIIFVNAEAEMYHTTVYDWLINQEKKRSIPVVNVGIGFKRPISELSYFQILLQYDLIQDRFTPYYVYPLSPLSLKLGLMVSLQDL